MNTQQTARQIVEEAFMRLYREHGIAVWRIEARWLDVSSANRDARIIEDVEIHGNLTRSTK